MIEDVKKLIEQKGKKYLFIERYKRLLEESSKPLPNVHLKLGWQYEKIGDKKSAILEYLFAGQLYLNIKEYTGALMANILVARIVPKHRDALANIAYIELLRGAKLSKEELKSFLQEIHLPLHQRAPSSASSRRKHAQEKSQVKKSNKTERKDLFQNYSKSSRKFFKELLLGRTDKESLIREYNQKIQASEAPLPEIHLQFGRLYEETGETKLATEQYLLAAQLYLANKEYAGALVANKLIIGLAPKHCDALASIAYIEMERGVKLSQMEFETYLQAIGWPLNKQGDDSTTETPEHQKLDRQEEEMFQANRKQLVDLIKDKPPKKSHSPQEGTEKNTTTSEGTRSEQTNTITSQQEQVASLVQRCSFFTEFSPTEKDRILQKSCLYIFAQNTVIMQTSNHPSSLFVLLEGEANLLVQDRQTNQKTSISLHPGEFWGEHVLFKQHDIVYSVAVKRSCTVLEIPKTELVPLASKYPVILDVLKKACRQRCFCLILSRFSLFEHLTLRERQDIANALYPVNVKKGDVIIKEGERDGSIYLIISGEVNVYTSLVEQNGLRIVQTDHEHLDLATLKAGDFFGAGASFTRESRSVTISALTDIALLKLSPRRLALIIQNSPRVGSILKHFHQQRVANTLKTLQVSL